MVNPKEDKCYEPKILAFLCNWCSYSGADAAGRARLAYSPNVRVIRVMCSGRVDPVYVLKAFQLGMDGVLICGCHPGDCHYITGNYRAVGRFTLLKQHLQTLGIEDERFRLDWVSATEGSRYAHIVNDMTNRLRKLGPLQYAHRATILKSNVSLLSDPE